jgi:pimeloyl-ACP methyl ester carboxylesterase
MEQDVRFLEVDGHRLACATVGEGPLLVIGGRWISDLEAEWSEPGPRPFFEALARSHRVVRYDRLGCGLSERNVLPTAESEVRSLAAVLDAFAPEPAVVFACSCATIAACKVAAAEPDRVRKLVFFGGWVVRDDIPEPTRRSLVELARTSWPLAAQMLAGLFAPDASGAEIAEISRGKRHAASPEVAAAYLELGLTFDLTPILARVEQPALVLHRRGDKTVPIAHARRLAAGLLAGGAAGDAAVSPSARPPVRDGDAAVVAVPQPNGSRWHEWGGRHRKRCPIVRGTSLSRLRRHPDTARYESGLNGPVYCASKTTRSGGCFGRIAST